MNDLSPRSAEAVMEWLLNREWRTEHRPGAGGVTHYVPGQVAAGLALSDDRGVVWMLAYTPPDGHGIVILVCEHAAGSDFCAGEWMPLPFRIRCDGFGVRWLKLPDDFRLTEEMVAELDRARAGAYR